MLMNTSVALKELIPVTPRGEATRKKLLASAEIEFGSKGFPAASVSSITQRADVGQGTFYLYFHSKEEVFATLVHELGRQQRQQVAAVLGQPGAKKNGEQLLVQALLNSIASDFGRYRILREVQFVDEPVFRATHEQLFRAVADVLAAMTHGITAAEALLRAAALVGACEQVALQQCLWADKPPSKAMAAVILQQPAGH